MDVLNAVYYNLNHKFEELLTETWLGHVLENLACCSPYKVLPVFLAGFLMATVISVSVAYFCVRKRQRRDLIEFTDEECDENYLDLHECYEKYVNLKGIDKVDYTTYLLTFDQLCNIPNQRKTGEYRKYLLSLIEYLTWFVQKVRPLMDIVNDLQNEVEEVMLQWECGRVPGWPKNKTGKACKEKEQLRQRELACLEAQVYRLAELVVPERGATIENVQKTQASYNCQNCGNYIYKGPKTFQRHFAGWTHAHGMRYPRYGPFCKCYIN